MCICSVLVLSNIFKSSPFLKDDTGSFSHHQRCVLTIRTSRNSCDRLTLRKIWPFLPLTKPTVCLNGATAFGSAMQILGGLGPSLLTSFLFWQHRRLSRRSFSSRFKQIFLFLKTTPFW